MEALIAIPILLILGAIAGLMAGLLGIGGGVVLVPGLYYILINLGYEQNAMHVAVGTSLLTIIFTGTSSALSHYKKNAVDTKLLKSFIPGVIFGVLIGSVLADIFSSTILKIIFATSQITLGSYMLFKSGNITISKNMPKPLLTSIISASNSCLATLMGIGGGVMNVLFMNMCNVNMHKAVATSAAIGPFIAIIGAAGFLIIGLDQTNLPPYNIGYLNMPAFLCIISASMLTAPLGAKIAHSVSVTTLKRYFSVFLLCVSAKMLMEVFM